MQIVSELYNLNTKQKFSPSDFELKFETEKKEKKPLTKEEKQRLTEVSRGKWLAGAGTTFKDVKKTRRE